MAHFSQQAHVTHAEPAWVPCFCDVWPGVTYSPTGPLMPVEQLRRQMLLFHGSRVDLGASDESAMPPALVKLQSRTGREASADERAACAAWYAKNPVVARSHLYDLLLEEVDRSILPQHFPASLLESPAWVRLRSRARLSDRVGLAEWLEGVHGSELALRCVRERSGARALLQLHHFSPCALRSGVDVASVLELLERGGDLGTLGLARLWDREGHPLAREARAVGSFFTRDLPSGSALGFYSGILLPSAALGEWMESLPTHAPAPLTPEDTAMPVSSSSAAPKPEDTSMPLSSSSVHVSALEAAATETDATPAVVAFDDAMAEAPAAADGASGTCAAGDVAPEIGSGVSIACEVAKAPAADDALSSTAGDVACERGADVAEAPPAADASWGSGVVNAAPPATTDADSALRLEILSLTSNELRERACMLGIPIASRKDDLVEDVLLAVKRDAIEDPARRKLRAEYAAMTRREVIERACASGLNVEATSSRFTLIDALLSAAPDVTHDDGLTRLRTELARLSCAELRARAADELGAAALDGIWRKNDLNALLIEAARLEDLPVPPVMPGSVTGAKPRTLVQPEPSCGVAEQRQPSGVVYDASHQFVMEDIETGEVLAPLGLRDQELRAELSLLSRHELRVRLYEEGADFDPQVSAAEFLDTLCAHLQRSPEELQLCRRLATLPQFDLVMRALACGGRHAVYGQHRGGLIALVARSGPLGCTLPPSSVGTSQTLPEEPTGAAGSIAWVDTPVRSADPTVIAAAPTPSTEAGLRLELLCLSRAELRSRIFALGFDDGIDLNGPKSLFVEVLLRAAATQWGPALHPSIMRLRECLANLDMKDISHRLLSLMSYQELVGLRKGQLIAMAVDLAATRRADVAEAFPEWVVSASDDPPAVQAPPPAAVRAPPPAAVRAPPPAAGGERSSAQLRSELALLLSNALRERASALALSFKNVSREDLIERVALAIEADAALDPVTRARRTPLLRLSRDALRSRIAAEGLEADLNHGSKQHLIDVLLRADANGGAVSAAPDVLASPELLIAAEPPASAAIEPPTSAAVELPAIEPPTSAAVELPATAAIEPPASAAAEHLASAAVAAASPFTSNPHDASSLLCKSLIWSYDCAAADSSFRLLGTGTYQGAFVRNVLSATNDFHGIADAPNIVKVPLLLGGFIPLVIFATSRATRRHEEALMEYGHEWAKTFCKYFPWAKSIFSSQKDRMGKTSDILISMGLELKQRTRNGRRGTSHEVQMQAAIARLLEREAAASSAPPAVPSRRKKPRLDVQADAPGACLTLPGDSMVVSAANGGGAAAVGVSVDADVGLSGLKRRRASMEFGDAEDRSSDSDDMCDSECALRCLVHSRPYVPRSAPTLGLLSQCPLQIEAPPVTVSPAAPVAVSALQAEVGNAEDSPVCAEAQAAALARASEHQPQPIAPRSELQEVAHNDPVSSRLLPVTRRPVGAAVGHTAGHGVKSVYPCGAGPQCHHCIHVRHSTHHLVLAPQAKLAKAAPTSAKTASSATGATVAAAMSNDASVPAATTTRVERPKLSRPTAAPAAAAPAAPAPAASALLASAAPAAALPAAAPARTATFASGSSVSSLDSSLPEVVSSKRSTKWMDGKWEYINNEELELRQAKATGVPTLAEMMGMWETGGRRTRGSAAADSHAEADKKSSARRKG